jgi:membrane protease YdiL (CAAX protease family)
MRARRHDPIPPLAALGAFASAVVAMVALGPLTGVLGPWGIALIQLAAVAAPAIVVASLTTRSPARALGLRPASARVLFGAALIGLSFWQLNLALIVPLNQALVGDDASLRRLSELLFEPAMPLWTALILLALLPAICEELLFRGALARALVPALGIAAAIAVQAMLFSLFHLSPARLLPALSFGVVLGVVALLSGSTLASALTHGLNNAAAITLATTGAGARALHAIEQHSVAAIALAAIVTLAGLWLVAGGRERPDRAEGQHAP